MPDVYINHNRDGERCDLSDAAPSMALSIIAVSLALVCVESALYGIFFVLAVTSLAVLLARYGKDAGPVAKSFSFSSTVKSPLFVATVVLLMTVSAVSPSSWLLLRALPPEHGLTDGWER